MIKYVIAINIFPLGFSGRAELFQIFFSKRKNIVKKKKKKHKSY